MQENEDPANFDDVDEFDLNWLHPPEDVHDAAGWDRYWQDQVDHGVACFSDIVLDDSLARAFLKRGLKTILCAGNGASLEPHVLAYTGFTVTAADLSTWVTQFGQSCHPGPKLLKRQLYGSIFFRPLFWKSARETLRRGSRLIGNVQKHLLNPLRRKSGTLEFLAGDLLDSEFCKGPFDVVIERCFAQLFSDTERNEILEKLVARLGPNGIFVSHCHTGWWRPRLSRNHLFEQWFHEHGFAIVGAFSEGEEIKAHSGRIALLSVSTG